MGKILSRHRTKTPLEELEKIEEEITYLEQSQQSTLEMQKSFVWKFISYAAVLYMLGFILALYTSSFNNKYCAATLILYPIVCYFGLKLITWIFKQCMIVDKDKLIDLRANKKKILDDVMDKETFKVAKEILEKFAPDQLQKQLSDRAGGKSPSKVLATPIKVSPKTSSEEMATGQREVGKSMTAGPPGSMRPPMETPRPSRFPQPPQRNLVMPVLPQDRSYIDKLIECIVGDGPNNRYALICANCSSHNGMALREDFEYIAFRCAYCGFPNPSRKVRPRHSTSQTPNWALFQPDVQELNPRDEEQKEFSSGSEESGDVTVSSNEEIEEEKTEESKTNEETVKNGTSTNDCS